MILANWAYNSLSFWSQNVKSKSNKREVVKKVTLDRAQAKILKKKETLKYFSLSPPEPVSSASLITQKHF